MPEMTNILDDLYRDCGGKIGGQGPGLENVHGTMIVGRKDAGSDDAGSFHRPRLDEATESPNNSVPTW
jgi:hypothetical protein